MKANEAPEKIYLSQERDKDGCYVDLMWHKHPYRDMENIQYVRTDAFIEKACEWLEAHSPFVNDDILDVWLDNFKEAMKL